MEKIQRSGVNEHGGGKVTVWQGSLWEAPEVSRSP